MIQKILFVSIFFIQLFCFNHSLSANGDPTSHLSAVLRSANPAPRSITDIHVIREELRIKPGLYTKVSVRYFLWNASDKDYKDIDYAFPIDYQGSGEKYVNSGLIGDNYSESSYALGWHDNYIKEVSFRANSVQLPFDVSPETVIQKPDKPIIQDKDEIETFGLWTKEEAEEAYAALTIGRKWFYTQFSVPARETVILDVDYSLFNNAKISAYEGVIRQWNESSFYYDLSPAAHWGNGVARDMNIEIDISGVSNVLLGEALVERFKYDYSEESKLPIQFEERDGKLVFRSRNFDFKSSLPVYIGYTNPSRPSLEEWLPYRIPNSEYKMQASKENASYPVSNLADMDLRTAWAVPWEKGEQISLSIKFDEPLRLGAILLLGGYHKSEKTYLENCRPEDISVSAKVLVPEYIYDEKTRKEISTGKYLEETREYNSPYHSEEKQTDCIGASFDNMIACSIIKQGNVWGNSLVKELTITIQDVLPGKKYSDLCVTELILLSENIFLTNRINNKAK